MGLRDLIFESDKGDKKPKSKKGKVSFPKNTNEGVIEGNANVFKSQTSAFDGFNPEPFNKDEKGNFVPQQIDTSNLSCEPHIDTVVSLYEKGFDALNKEGYDFYEYYKAVLEAGADNAAVYKMALTMAKAMDPNVSKETLIKQSEYYLTEITNVYKQYVEQGNQKKNSIQTQKSTEESSLQTQLKSVQSQLAQLQQTENSLKIQIGAIDNKYAAQLHDISCKLEANDTAKREIFESINKVKRGINANL